MIELRRERPRLHRVEKPSVPSLANSILASSEASNDHTWIVSYADLLMILLCFFVLFFSISPDSQESILHKILLTEENPSVPPNEIRQNADSTGTQSIPSGDRLLFRKISSELAGAQLNTSLLEDTIVFELPNNSFAKGKVDLVPKQKRVLARLFARLKPYATEINVVLIGHTDRTKVVSLKKKRIYDNFDLSAARAKSAYQIAIQSKFPESHLKLEGDSSFDRASRTLSIVIKARAKPEVKDEVR